MMIPLLDIAPYYPPLVDDHPPIRVVVKDTVDTVSGVAQQISDNVQSTGSGTKIAIFGAILAALVGLGFLLFFVAQYRKKTQLGHAIG